MELRLLHFHLFPHQQMVEDNRNNQNGAFGYVLPVSGDNGQQADGYTQDNNQVPMMVFATDPSPPEKAVPPSSTAMMQLASMPSPDSGSPSDM